MLLLLEGTVHPSCGKFPRTTMSVVELLVTPHCRPEMRQARVVTAQNEMKGRELFIRWIRERSLYQVPSEFQCDRTFAERGEEMQYIESTITEILERERRRRSPVFVGIPKRFDYPPSWCEDHRKYTLLKTMDELRRVLGAPVDPMD